MLLWSDNGTNYVGVHKELEELQKFLEIKMTHTLHFGGLWEPTVKSFKNHLQKVARNMKLTYKEMATVLTQIEACLNSCTLSAVTQEDDSVEALTPGHFLIGRPIEALPNSSQSFGSLSLLCRWHLRQALTHHFW